MFKALFLLFIIVPIIEIALLIQVSDVIGGWNTIALVIITAFLGARLVRQQGSEALRNVQLQLAQGQMPAQELLTGLCVIIAGVLLLTPGIATDLFGFLLLTPIFRKVMASKILTQLSKQQASGQQGFHFSHHHAPREESSNSQQQGPTTLDGEFKRKD